jgi:RNAse (barnase) inhibitor barstar
MADILLDITPLKRNLADSYLKELDGLPFYYGAELDALYDELASISSHEITLVFTDAPTGHERLSGAWSTVQGRRAG